MINKNTNLYISIAANPGNIGANFYNKKFKTNSLNSIYLPIKPNSNIKNLKSTLKFLNIKGCSVSMPYKKKVISILDNVEKVAKKLQSVNTIVQKNHIRNATKIKNAKKIHNPKTQKNHITKKHKKIT